MSPRLSGADGVHVGQDDLSAEQARAIVGEEKLVGVSTHNLEQFREAAATSADYIAVGPIFATKSKANPDPVVGTELIRQVRSLTEKPIVAIGGITLETAASVIEAGADCVAVISDILRAADRAPARACNTSTYSDRRNTPPPHEAAADAQHRHSRTGHPQANRTRRIVLAIRPRFRARFRPRHRSVRRHHDRRRLDDRLRHLHRGRGNQPPDRLAGRPAAHLDRHRAADGFRGAFLRRTCRAVSRAPAVSTSICAKRTRRCGDFSTAGRCSW